MDQIEAEKLKEQGKYKELYEETAKKLADAEDLRRYDKMMAQLQAKVRDAGGIDESIADLIPRDGIKMDGDKFIGLDESVQKFKAEKPKLFAAPAAPAPAAPAAPASLTKPGALFTPPAPASGAADGHGKDVNKLNRNEYSDEKVAFIRGLKKQA